MKTTDQNIEAPAPANVRPSSVTKRPALDFHLRQRNRRLPTNRLLELLHQETPRFWEVAEVVGRWVWIQFREKQPSEVTSSLSQLGFHWNRTRQAWQHPCGSYQRLSTWYDPRRRYGSYFPADRQAA